MILYGTKGGYVFLMSTVCGKDFWLRRFSRAMLSIPARQRYIMISRISIGGMVLIGMWLIIWTSTWCVNQLRLST